MKAKKCKSVKNSKARQKIVIFYLIQNHILFLKEK